MNPWPLLGLRKSIHTGLNTIAILTKQNCCLGIWNLELGIWNWESETGNLDIRKYILLIVFVEFSLWLPYSFIHFPMPPWGSVALGLHVIATLINLMNSYESRVTLFLIDSMD